MSNVKPSLSNGAEIVHFEFESILRYTPPKFREAWRALERGWAGISTIRRDDSPGLRKMTATALNNAWTLAESIREQNPNLAAPARARLDAFMREIERLHDEITDAERAERKRASLPVGGARVISLDAERARRGLRVPRPRLSRHQLALLAGVAQRRVDPRYRFATKEALERRGLIAWKGGQDAELTPLGRRALALYGVALAEASSARDA